MSINEQFEADASSLRHANDCLEWQIIELGWALRAFWTALADIEAADRRVQQ